jgi:hypothetical protein
MKISFFVVFCLTSIDLGGGSSIGSDRSYSGNGDDDFRQPARKPMEVNTQ